jgi:hypothetical protein
VLTSDLKGFPLGKEGRIALNTANQPYFADILALAADGGGIEQNVCQLNRTS